MLGICKGIREDITTVEMITWKNWNDGSILLHPRHKTGNTIAKGALVISKVLIRKKRIKEYKEEKEIR